MLAIVFGTKMVPKKKAHLPPCCTHTHTHTLHTHYTHTTQVASATASMRKVESDAARRQALLFAPLSDPAASLAGPHGVRTENMFFADAASSGHDISGDAEIEREGQREGMHI